MIITTTDKTKIPKKLNQFFLSLSVIGMLAIMGHVPTAIAADCPQFGSCSAGDVTLGTTTVSAPATCVQGEMVTVSITANLKSTAAERSDGALYLITDQGANQCIVGKVAPLPGEPDDCGNLPKGVERPATITTQVLCDGNINTALQIPAVAVWSQNQDDAQCQIGTGSKCNDTIKIETNITVITPAPKLTVTKSPDPIVYTSIGQVITYSYTVTNSGNVTIDGVSLTDNKLPGADLSDCDALTLDPGDSTTCTGSYTITANDLSANTVTNIATAAGSYNDAPVSATATATVTELAITLDKTANPSSYTTAGTVINYSFVVTNTGGASLDPVTLSDPLAGLTGLSCPQPSLASGASMTCTATYTATASDVAAQRTIQNTATVVGTYSVRGVLIQTVQDTDDAIVAFQAPAAAPGISLEKSALPSLFTNAGETITYSFLVQNTGTAEPMTIIVTDPLAGLGAINCPTTSLNTGQSTTCTATYTTKASDVTAGVINNTATAVGKVSGFDDVQAISSAKVVKNPNAGLAINKVADKTTYSSAGTVITYTYTITNTGNEVINSIVINDNVLGQISGCAVSLNIGQSSTCTASYTTTQANLDDDLTITNTATVTGTPANGALPTPQPASASVDAIQAPVLTLEKLALTTNYDAVGDLILYEYTVTNTGNITLSNLVITDNKISTVTCTTTTLAPQGMTKCTANYTVTQEDLDAGSVVNIAAAKSSTPQNTEVASPNAEETVPAEQRRSLSLDKTSDPKTYVKVGDVIKYEFIVTNTGNVNLPLPVTITDPTITGISCPSTPNPLKPGVSITCTGNYTITQADMDKGQISNTAKATMGTTNSNEDTHIINTQQTKSLSVEKENTKVEDAAGDKGTANEGIVSAGDKLFYTITVTNTGNQTLANVLVDDPLTGLKDKVCSDSLAPQKTCTVTVTYLVTATDVKNGFITNTATAHSGDTTGSDSETVQIPLAAAPDGQISMIKSVTRTEDKDNSETVTLGDTIYYRVIVANTGAVPLTNLVVVDPMLKITLNTCTGTLAISASCTVEGYHVVTEDDVRAGKITNTATATSDQLQGSASSNTVVIEIAQAIPVFGPLGLIATLLGLMWLSRRRRDSLI